MQNEAFWMPFSANRDFKAAPRLVERSSGMYYYDEDGQPILDMAAGLWCSNLGHGREEVAAAIGARARELDYAPSFNIGHPDAFILAERLVAEAADDINHVFFTTSGSEAVDTALKIALAYQRLRGNPGKNLLVSRSKAYHGVNFGGTAVGGVSSNTAMFERWGNVQFLPHTLDIERNAFSRGLPEQGVDRADALLDIIEVHGADAIAAVIVEPVAGAGGMIPPPQGYLERLAKICRDHDILVIFDEVICGFGRIGGFTGGDVFGVTPDIFTSAKGLTNGAVPMGAVFVSDEVYDVFMQTSSTGIEFWHGYTYSAHPLACAAALACLDVYSGEALFTRATGPIADELENALHTVRGLNGVIDVRNVGLLGAVQFQPGQRPGQVGGDVVRAAWQQGLVVRGLGDTIAVSPPLNIESQHIREFSEKITRAIQQVVGS
ncbi:MAG: aminotransferase class III-fold pyridoxal phosphate-dependent enzyme [Pseudomonadota bacterium]